MGDIVTEADMLMEILAERGAAPVSLIAHVIGVDEVVIENWARIHEKHGMVQLHYPLLGKPVVEFKAAETLRDEFKSRFLSEQERKANLAEAEVPPVEALLKSVNDKNACEIHREIRGRLSKVEGLMDKFKEVSARLNVGDEKISVKYGEIIDKYKSLLLTLEEKCSMEEY
jgi:hypothetical protein